MLATDHAEDELISLDELQEQIQEFDDYIQSSDVAAMQSMYPQSSHCDLFSSRFPSQSYD